ncbi:MAG TPA: type VI secretion system tip protein TssI/VgrG [Pyrinomonadaceae bacterium]|nr:type VI secretion system tip protein TssI/VgrG [Pyrinomonadaceae bacterium]
MLSLTTPLPYDQLLIKRLRSFEGISQLFRYELEILHDHDAVGDEPDVVDPKKLIGQPMVVHVQQHAGEAVTERHFHGICSRFTQGSRNSRWTKYKALVVPKAWLLTQRHQSRIFQQKSVPDILKTVFNGLEVKWEFQGTYEPRNYCVQYRESDFDFASRLMEEEGIFYFFKHSENSHLMVVADSPQAHIPCPSKDRLPYALDRSSISEQWVGSILTWKIDDQIRTGKYTLWDHNFELVGKKLAADQLSRFNIGGNQNLEFYDFPGDYAKRFDGVDPGGGERAADLNKIFTDNKRTVGIRQQEIDVAYKNGYGDSDSCSMMPGYRFTMLEHPVAAYNNAHVIVSVKTEAVQSPSYVSNEPVPNCYSVSFTSITFGQPDSPPFRPLRRTPKPIVHGSQTATVVGPAGQEIFTDKYGRVKVQFHWDREGKNDEGSSCWVRVAHMSAGKKWGAISIPRIGFEVLVDFLEGDPDQPIIVGSVYNAENMPPYTLPDEKTKSTFKSNSTMGGGGFNEFRFEDKKGSEQIFIHAEKNQDIRVKNDCMELIQHDRHLEVSNNQNEKVGADKSLTVGGNQTEKVGGSLGQSIGGSQDVKVSQKYALDAGTEIHLKAGVTTVIEAGASLTLKVGGNFVAINAGGIFVKGTMVMLNSGGAAGSGSGASPGSPTAPKEADNAVPGQVTRPPAAPPPAQPAKFANLANIVRERASNPQAPSLESAIAQQAAAPVAAVTDQVQNAVEKAQGTAEQTAQQAKGAALGFFAAAQAAILSKIDQVKQAVDSVKDKVMDKVEQAKALAQDLKDNAEAYADEALAKVQEAREKAEALIEEGKQAAEEAKQAVEEKVDEAQQAAADAQQAAEEKVDEAKQAVGDAQQAAEQKMEEAQQAVDDAKETATQAADDAQQAAEQVSEQATSALQGAQDAIPFM